MDHVRRRRQRKQRIFTPEQYQEHDHYIGLANQAYLLSDYSQCIACARRAIQHIPSASAFELLHSVYREKGAIEKSMEYRLLQAHIDHRNAELWEELLEYYRGQPNGAVNYELHIIYVLGRLLPLTSDPDQVLNIGLYRASMLTRAGEGTRAQTQYEQILRTYPYHVEAYTELANLYYHLGNAPKAIAHLTKYIEREISPEEIPHMLYAAGIRSEIQTESGRLSDTVNDILQVVTYHRLILEETPALYTKYLVAHTMLASDKPREHETLLQRCLSSTSPEVMLDHYDLLYDTANALLRFDHPHLSEILLKALSEIPSFDKLPEASRTALYFSLARCASALSDSSGMVEFLRRVLESSPTHVESHLMLAQHYFSIGEGLDTVLSHLKEYDGTDPVLSLRLAYHRAIFFLHQDTRGVLLPSERRLLARTDLLRIIQASLRDPPVHSLVLDKRKRTRMGQATSASVYPSSTMTMTQIVDRAGGIRGDAPSSVASTFHWESRPFDRPAGGKSQRYDTASVRSSMPQSNLDEPNHSLFRFNRKQKCTFTSTSQSTERNRPMISGEGSEAKAVTSVPEKSRTDVANLEDLEVFEEMAILDSVIEDIQHQSASFESDHSSKADQNQANSDDLPNEIEDLNISNLPPAASITILNWTDVKIALPSESDFFEAIFMLVATFDNTSDHLYWLTSVQAAHRLKSVQHRENLLMTIFHVAMQAGHDGIAMQQITQLLRNSYKGVILWNKLSDLFTRLRHTSAVNAFRRIAGRTPNTSNSFPIQMLLGHTYAADASMNQVARSAIRYYGAFSVCPNDSLAPLCLAFAYARWCRSRASDLRHRNEMWLLSWGFAARHRINREKEAKDFGWLEGTYNMARISDYVGLQYLACKLYQEVLNSTRTRYGARHYSIPKDDERSYQTLLRCSAFNLHVIYRQSGNFDLAHAVLCRYIVL